MIKDHERLRQTLAELRFVAFARLLVHRANYVLGPNPIHDRL